MTHKEYYTKHIADLRSREKALNAEMINCDDKEARAKLPGSPKIIGLDIIWGLEKDGDEYFIKEFSTISKSKFG